MMTAPNSLILYNGAVCNLNCTYCFIDKNPVLKEIDRKIHNSFLGNYYIDFAKKIFPDPKQVTEVQIWGGEPFLFMDRVASVLEKLLNVYIRCTRIVVSTNFVSDNFMVQFVHLAKCLSKVNRHFYLNMQLSLDGPSEFTDRGRGTGTTKKFLERYHEFLGEVDTVLPKNVSLTLPFKQTFDSVSLGMLQDKQSILEYYRFFEGLYDTFEERGFSKERVDMHVSVPNTANPSPHTKEDGELFRRYMEAATSIDCEREFKYYKDVRLYSHGTPCDFSDKSMVLSGCTCNTGIGMVGLLPDEKISLCHMSFVDLLDDFKHSITGSASIDKSFFDRDLNVMTLHYTELPEYARKISLMYAAGTKARFLSLVNAIRLEASVGNVSKEYFNEDRAIWAARLLTHHTCFCIRDNINITGSVLSTPVGLIRLLLNGGEKYI